MIHAIAALLLSIPLAASSPPAGDEWIDSRRAEEIKKLVADVLADADTRTNLRDQDLTAGHDGDFFIQSEDGGFRLEISGRLQARYVRNRRKGDRPAPTLGGFELRRAKLAFKGHVAGGNVFYSIGTAFDDNGGGLDVESFYLGVEPSEGLRLRIGRSRPGVLREEIVSSAYQLTAERSLVTRAFDQPRDLGVFARMRGETTQLELALTDDGGLMADERSRASARLDLLLDGSWGRLRDLTSFPDDDPLTAIGFGILYQRSLFAAIPDVDGDPADPSEIFDERILWTVDLSIEFGGANFFAALVGNRQEQSPGSFIDQLGGVVQIGAFFSDDWEFFTRYEWGDAGSFAPDLSIITVGVNRYIDEHDVKWTLDVGYGLGEVGSFWSSAGAGWRSDGNGIDGQVVLRTQFQIRF